MTSPIIRGAFITLRIILVLVLMVVVAFFALGFYYKTVSEKSIVEASQDKYSISLGNIESKAKLVEFFDYRCPHCPVLSQAIQEATKNYQNAEVILRPIAIVDSQSTQIAQFVLASGQQKSDYISQLHELIMKLSVPPSYEEVKTMARSLGVNIDQAEREATNYQSYIQYNQELLLKIGFGGVPALLVGDKPYLPTSSSPSINEIRLMILDAEKDNQSEK